MRYSLQSDELLIFRDGRPFGDSGTFGGRSLNWPNSQTLTGMVRSATGFAVQNDYFSDENNTKQILGVGVEKILPVCRKDNKWQYLVPVPADLIFTMDESIEVNSKDVESESGDARYIVYPLKYENNEVGAGTDIQNTDWLIPFVDLREKPAKQVPYFLHFDFLKSYLAGELMTEQAFSLKSLGVSAPLQDFRIHNALDSVSLATEQGKLFANAGIYLRSHTTQIEKGETCELAIQFTVTSDIDSLSSVSIAGDAFLGGERRRVRLGSEAIEFPAFPEYFNQKRFLRLLLTTHGDFGGWCPDWLMPDFDQDTIGYVNVPGLDKRVRLRSACVAGWDGVSGWDYCKKAPKAMKKLVKPGAVYVIEVEHEKDSEEIAKNFWGASLDPANVESTRNGYNQCLVGVVGTLEKNKLSEKDAM